MERTVDRQEMAVWGGEEREEGEKIPNFPILLFKDINTNHLELGVMTL